MFSISTITYLLAGSASLTAAFGAWTDLRQRKIGNYVCLALAVLSGATLVAMQGWDALGSSAIHFTLALLVGMALFAIGWIGGGDAKFYAAAALAVPLDKALALLMWTSISGALVLTALIIRRRVKGETLSKDPEKAGQVPFGVAIFLGFLVTISNSLL